MTKKSSKFRESNVNTYEHAAITNNFLASSEAQVMTLSYSGTPFLM